MPASDALSGDRASRAASSRLAAATALARAHRAPLSDAEIRGLLGSEVPDGVERGSPLWQAQRLPIDPDWVDRCARGERFREEGEVVARSVLQPVAPLLRCLGLTGSTAYGSPVAGDDLDFLVIVRRGSVWPFLLFAWLAARWKRPRSDDGPRGWCFNLVLDETEARKEFARPRGFLVAREALMVHPLRGAPYYRALVTASPWIRAEIPALFEERFGAAGAPVPSPPRVPLAVRLANLVLFPLLATYLQAMALFESARYRAAGSPERTFRVTTKLGKVVVATERFAELDRMWQRAARVVPPEAHG